MARMPREYGQFCGLAHALDLVGGRWSLLVIRDLLSGPKRFKDLEEGLAGIPTNVLSGRLRELEESGIIRRHVRPRPAGGVVYELTDYGRELEGAVVQLGMWGAKTLGASAEGRYVSLHGLAPVLRAGFRAENADGLRRRYELRVAGRSLFVSLDDGELTVTSEVPEAAVTATLEVAPEALMPLLSGQVRPDDALVTGQLTVTGSKAEVRRFFRLFRASG